MSISVSSLVKYLKNKLDSDDKLHNVQVTGELSNFHLHQSGHLYFTLKDEKSAIACVMFASKAASIKFAPKNGDKVDVSANVSVFEVSGQMQLYVNTMKLAGIGDLYQQYEELKRKLTDEGYFNPDHKKEIPTLYPNKIAVLVGDKSAAMSDIKTCFARRWPIVEVDYYPVLVQGADAPKDIINRLKEVDELDYEMIVLARGGGSFEDLFCFNNESLVKTIYDLKTFIVDGVGHEQDFTLTDFVSDLRAPTPTAAVELITPNIVEVIEDIEDGKNKLTTLLINKMELSGAKLDYLSSKLTNYSNKFDLLITNINTLKKDLDNCINNRLNNLSEYINSKRKLLDAYSIDQTLKRGFALVYKDDALIKSRNKVEKDDNLRLHLIDGDVKVKVE